jgi:hypothetical protein
MLTPRTGIAALAAILSLTIFTPMVRAADGSEPDTDNHAAEGARPGSHEDWCGEHAVPESQCTRCNSKLIPAFKATGDWCAEHGLPESQCLICDPDLAIERPPKAGGR